MTSPHGFPHAALLRNLVPPLLLLGTVLALVALVVQGRAGAGSPAQAPGTGILRYGNSWSTGSGYDRYQYVTVGPGDAAAAGALATTSLVYMSGSSVQTSWSTGVSYQEALANDWLLKDASGQYVRNVAYGAYIGDIGNSAYQQRFVSNVAALLAANGNEGVFIDDVQMSPTIMTGGVYPAKYPTQRAWEDATVSFIAAVGPALEARGFYVLANAAAYISGNAASDDGTLTAGFWRRLAPSVSGLMSEYWEQLPPDPTQLRASGTSSWTQHWDGWFDLVQVAQSGGADFFGLMEGSTTSTNLMRYGKASFLLGWDGSGGSFVYHPSGDPWNLEWTMDIGQPSGARYPVGAGWRRDYSGGTVLLNPSPSASQTFSLGGTYTRADGTAVTSVTLGPTSGLVLKGGSPQPPPPPPAPVNTAPPTISGAAQQGQQLAASNGTWTNSPTSYAYQWKRCDAAGANCASLAGATSAQYLLGSGDVGKTMRVTVTASNDTGPTAATSTATAAVAALPGSSPPASTAPPAISGTAQQGQTLSASTGAWSGSPTGYAYQWRRCDSAGANCASVAGAASAQYPLGSTDVGKTMRVTVTASNAGGSSSATSNATATVAAPPTAPAPTPTPPANTAPPTISGTAQQGQTLSTSTGAWSGSPTGYAYQWRRCDSAGSSCSSISGATTAQFALGTSDVGATLRVVVTASNTAGSAAVTSAASAVVSPAPAPAPPAPTPPAPSPPASTAPPTVSGTAQEAATLTSSTGNWSGSPTGYAYQWRRCDSAGANCATIAGATAATYVLGTTDVGRALRVAVTATNTAGSASATSNATSVVAPAPAPPPTVAPPANVVRPSLMGPRQVGKEIKSAVGEWVNTPTRYTYQWLRCKEIDSECDAIVGATTSTYLPLQDDVGFYVVVSVRAWNDGGSASATSVERPNDQKRIRG
jgi:putative glycosyl hydrolase-like family 15 (GHL15) protein